MASWNHSQYASTELTASEFRLQGSVDGINYQHREDDEAHQLVFNPELEALSPGSQVYAPFSIRTSSGSIAGEVLLVVDPENSPNGEGLGQWAQYRVAVTENPGCTAGSFSSGNVIVGDSQDNPVALTVGADESSVQQLAASGDAPVHYCFEFSLPENTPVEAQGTSVSPEWEFLGTSQ